jgi:hypothetical protein
MTNIKNKINYFINLIIFEKLIILIKNSENI